MNCFTAKRLRVLNSFEPLHYGTFGGILTRILYVFVGLAPLILFITGFVIGSIVTAQNHTFIQHQIQI
ncbi:PepSY-associated TM helix domain-containing protein [Nostoc sp.]|uniref:PepSY-associated TM helix domain-containing protein n=1 Tax=Nostoc sp. TaxID=1180 RepID=UPI002FF71D45